MLIVYKKTDPAQPGLQRVPVQQKMMLREAGCTLVWEEAGNQLSTSESGQRRKPLPLGPTQAPHRPPSQDPGRMHSPALWPTTQS